MYPLDATLPVALHRQLYEALKNAIVTEYRVGEKLPSLRKLSSELNLSKTTVQRAIDQLYAEGYIESRPQSGYYVADFQIYLHALQPLAEPLLETPAAQTPTIRYDLHPSRLPDALFPFKQWQLLYNGVVRSMPPMGSYRAGEGELGLRKAITSYLHASRGVRCDASQLLICSGFSDAMQIVTELLNPDCRGVALESPGYPPAYQSFERTGYTIEAIAVGSEGVKVDLLAASRAKVVYITPSHQFPTGVTLPLAQRLQLLTWADYVQGYIIEDDYDSELRYTTQPIPSLQGIDERGRVIYLGTFSKVLSPALRISYLILPKALLKRYQERFKRRPASVDLLTQLTLQQFLEGGHWERHLRKVRTLGKQRYHHTLALLQTHLKEEVEIIDRRGGLNIVCRPKRALDITQLRQSLEKEGIYLRLGSDYFGEMWEALFIGFGGVDETALEAVIPLLGRLVREAQISA